MTLFDRGAIITTGGLGGQNNSTLCLKLHFDRITDSLHCFYCHLDIEIPRRILRQPEAFLMFRESMEAQHKACSIELDRAIQCLPFSGENHLELLGAVQ